MVAGAASLRQLPVVVLLVGGLNRLSGASWAAHIDDAGHVDTGAVSRVGKSTSFNLLWGSVFSSEHRETLSSVGRLSTEVVQPTMHRTIPSALDR